MNVAVMLMCLPRALIEPSERRRSGFAGPLALPPRGGAAQPLRGWAKSLRQVGQLGQEGVGRGEPQRDTGADDERRVDQAEQQVDLLEI